MNTYITVDDFLNDQPPDKRVQIEALQTIIHNTEPNLEAHIKWNAPSYVWNGEDRITFNVNNKEGVVKLVFHMGATRKENKNEAPILKNTPLIKWVSDIRGYMTFRDLQEISNNQESIGQHIKSWLALH